MRSFLDTFETRKQLFISAFSICMTVPLMSLRFSHRGKYNELKSLQLDHFYI